MTSTQTPVRVVDRPSGEAHARVTRLALSMLLLAVSTPSTMAADGTRITDTNAPFLYESRADIPAPDHKLAAMISSEYRNAEDEFTRHDLFQRTKPVVDRRLREGRETERVYLLVGGRLAEYDFDKIGFPSGFTEQTYIPFDKPYQVRFTNVNDFAFIPVPMDKARALAGALRRSRGCSFTIEGKVDRATEVDRAKVLYVTAVRVEVSLESGTNVATLQIGPANQPEPKDRPD